MTAHDPNREFAVHVVRRLKEAGHTALWAGGCVRDYLLGRVPKDYDVATDARPDEVRDLFGNRRTHAVGASFGVIIVQAPQDVVNVEIATFRTEGPYLDGRRPEHVSFSSPEQDALRRDFTINGIFYDPVEQQVFDFVGGEQDLGGSVVRAIGDPHDRMREDKLRMLRAVRFAATLQFELDSVTADAIREMADQMLVVSAERIAGELKQMLVDPRRMRAMQLTARVGLLAVILPELAPFLTDSPNTRWDRTLHMLNLLEGPGFELAAAALLHAVRAAEGPHDLEAAGQIVRRICKRLRLSNREIEHVGWLLEHQHDLEEAPRQPLAKLKQILAHPLIDDLLALSRSQILARNADLSSVIFCEEYLRNTPAEQINPAPLLTGNDLIDLGITPGPKFKLLIEAVRDAQLNGEVTTWTAALELAGQLQGNQ